MKKHITISLYFILVLFACVDKYQPKLDNAPNLLVIEGMVSNQNEAYEIRITKLKNLNSIYSDSISKARVWVVDDKGGNFPFIEKSKGIYVSNPNTFIGQIGNTYTLYVETLEGGKYESTPEKMPDNPEVKSITASYRDDIPDKEGFYVDIEISDVPNQQNFYRWETTYYKYKNFCGTIGEFSVLCCEPCWQIFRKPNEIVLSNDELYKGQSSTIEDIYVIPYESRSTANINIIQYSYTERAYQYWVLVRKQISNVGSIFDPTPFSITGNIANINKPKEKVLGLFTASSISVVAQNIKRDYINKNPKFVIEPPPAFPPPPCEPCEEIKNISTKKKPLGWLF